MSKQSQSPAKPSGRAQMSSRTKMILLIVTGSVIVIGGATWAYLALTVLPPPDLKTATPAEVAQFFGHKRGFAWMPLDRREEYFTDTFRRFSTGPDRRDFSSALHQMTQAERGVFLDAFLEVGKKQFVEQAREYNRLVSPKQRAAYVNQAITRIEEYRRTGAGSSRDMDFGDPFKDDLPTGGDELAKRLVTLTTPRERAEAQQFADDMAARYAELDKQKRSAKAALPTFKK